MDMDVLVWLQSPSTEEFEPKAVQKMACGHRLCPFNSSHSFRYCACLFAVAYFFCPFSLLTLVNFIIYNISMLVFEK